MNLLDHIPDRLPEEFVEILASSPGVRIERIISAGHVSPPDFWYDQDEHEWVCVLRGEGHIAFDDGEVAELKPGDWINIRAHRKHRVTYTSAEPPTIWLAVFHP